jgi:hypothetical protein
MAEPAIVVSGLRKRHGAHEWGSGGASTLQSG